MLSVIIPSYNRSQSLEKAILSVLNQQISMELECIVIDDGSTDDTRAMLRAKFPSVKVCYQENQGVSSARNSGIEIAKGEWIALLDSDDEWLPNKLHKQFELLNANDLKVCHTQEIWIRNGVRVNQMKKHGKEGGRIFLNCLPLCAMSPSSIIIHQSVFEEVGVFDVNLPACEDYDLWLRICAVFDVGYIKEPCIKKYGGHSDQLSRLYWGMDRFRVIALEKILLGKLDSLSQREQESTHAILIRKLTILLKGAQKHDNSELQKLCESKLECWRNWQFSAAKQPPTSFQ